MKFSLRRVAPAAFSVFLLMTLSLTSWGTLAPPPPAPSVSGSLTVCTGDAGIYTASITPANPNVVFRWSKELVVGIYTFQFQGNPYNTGVLAPAGNYRVVAYDVVSGLTSAPTDFTVVSAPLNLDVVTATPADLTICAGDSTTLNATSVLGNTNFVWYDALTGGNLLYTGNPYNTGPLFTVPSVYVASLNANGCASNRLLAVQPVVVPALNVPLANPLAGTNCSGSSTTFTATSVVPGGTFKWYTTLSGGTPIATGPTFTPVAKDNTGSGNLIDIYYVEVVDANGCTSLRTPVTQVTLPALNVPLVNPLASTVCSGGSTTFTASTLLGGSVSNYYWYDSLTGGNLLYTGNPYARTAPVNTGSVNLTDIVYVEVRDTNGCASLRTPATQVIVPALDVPLVNPLAITACAGSTATFTASALLGNTDFHWFDAIVGGNEVFVGNPYSHTVPANNSGINVTDIVYVEVRDTNGCTSLRTPATVIIPPAINLPIVNPPAATACAGDTVQFVATSLLGGSQFHWFDALLGGNEIYVGNPYDRVAPSNPGAVNLTDIIYVEVRDTNGCSSLRTPATIVVPPALDLAIVNPLATTACNGDTVTFTASSLLGGVTFNWYDALLGGNLLYTGNPYTTAIINSGTTDLTSIFYVEVQDVNGCTSLRTPATVLTLPALDVPLVNPLVATICSGDTATFTASSLLGATTFHWFDSALGGNELFVGPTYSVSQTNTGVANLTSMVYVEAEDSNGCRSLRIPATVIVTPALDLALVNPLVSTVCNGDSSTFTATSLLGSVTFNWYDAIIDGNLLYSGNPYTTSPISNTGTTDITRITYVEVVDTNGCRSLRTPATEVTLPAIDVPVVMPPVATVCSSDSVTFTVTSLLGNTVVNWYDSIVGGNLIYTGATFNTGTISNPGSSDLTKIFYVETVDSNGCKSVRVPATVVITPTLNVPLVTPLVSTICSGNSAQFTASTLIGTGVQYYWYDSLLNGTLLYTGSTYTTPPITNSGTVDLIRTYYVEVRDGNGCSSLRTPAVLTITPALDVPVAIPPVQTTCNGKSVEFRATSLLGSATTFNWYDSISGGNLLYSGDTFTTGAIYSSGPTDLTRIYYVEVQDTNGCKSLRTPATVLLTPAIDLPVALPPVRTICNGDSTSFNALSLIPGNKTFGWYDSITAGNLIFVGDSFNTGAIYSNGPTDLTRIYYLEVQDSNGCASLRTPATVVITPALAVPLVNPPLSTVCNGDSAEFVATTLLTNALEYRWYDSITAGNLLFIGDTFNTGAITSSGPLDLLRTYYVELVDSNGCTSLRVPVIVTITPALDVPLVNPPLATVCNGNSAEFVASTLLSSGVTFNWYDSLLASTPVFTGDTFNTPNITNTGIADIVYTYYVEAVDSNGCRSLRVPVVITITPALAVPLVIPPVQTVCNGQSAEFVATSVLLPVETFRWYTTLLGGSYIYEGDTFITAPLSNPGLTNLDSIYYVEAIDSNGCASLRTPVTAIVVPAIDVPLVTPLVTTVCNGDSAEFVASSLLNPNATFRWFDAITNGNLLYTGDTFTTGGLNNSSGLDLARIYYVESVDSNGCVSAVRVPATVVIRPSLQVPIATPPVDLICNGGSAQFVGTSLLNPTATFSWYDSLLGGNLIYNGDTFVTGPLYNTSGLDLTRIYYLEATDSLGCKSLRTPATLVIRPAIDVPLVNPPVGVVCSGTDADFVATSLLNPNATFNWYDSLLAGNLLYTGDTFNTGTLENPSLVNLLKVYYVESVDSVGCTSLRIPVVVTVLPSLAIPVVAPVAPVCSGSSATLIANDLLAGSAQFNWYDSLTGTTPVFTGDTFVTGPLVSNGVLDITRTYYVESQDSTGCRSVRVPVVVVLIPALNLPVVIPPVQAVCNGTSATFVANAVLPGDVTFEWYDALNDGNLLYTGDTFVTGPLTNPSLLNLTEDFYVQLVDSNGCASLRTPAIALITPAITVPVVNPLIQTICSGDSAEYVASSLLGNSVNYRWYDALANGTLLFVGDTFNTGPVLAGGTLDVTRLYYVESFDSIGCTSVRTPATLVVTPNPDVIVLTPVRSTVCKGTGTTITAVSSLGNTEINWYLQPSGDTAIFTGNVYNTGILDNTITYYVSSNSAVSNCESSRYPVTIAVQDTVALEAPEVSCERVDNNTIRFSWNEVAGANGYEVSNDGGTTWMKPSSGMFGKTHIESRTSNDQEGASLRVRALNQTNECGPREGKASIGTFCTFFEGITDDFKTNNSFSPNGDGVNDVWVIGEGLQYYPKNTVTVFNRWGKEVFRTTGYDNRKNVFTAEGLDDGSYFYVITIPEVNVEKTGYVMVIR